MSEKQVTVKSMMLDFAARLRGEGTDSVSLEFFERLANTEVAALEERLSSITNFTLENSAEVPESVRGDRDWWQQNAAFWYGIAQRNMEAEAKLSKMEARLLSVLEVAVARGEKLGYADEDYREALAGESDDEQ